MSVILFEVCYFWPTLVNYKVFMSVDIVHGCGGCVGFLVNSALRLVTSSGVEIGIPWHRTTASLSLGACGPHGAGKNILLSRRPLFFSKICF